MNKIKDKWYPTEKYLRLIRKEIDYILDNGDISQYLYYEGAGRTVVIIDKVAIKIPEYNKDIKINGYTQNKKEYEVYTKTKHSLLNPIYDIYRDCLICKEVLGDIYVLENDYNFNYDEIMKTIDMNLKKLSNVIVENNLSITELKASRNWGYDFSNNELVCLDYGI